MKAALKDWFPTARTLKNFALWLREKLFSSALNTLLTLLTVGALFVVLRAMLTWAFTEAQWGVVPANFRLLMVGPYPLDDMWRIWSGVAAFSLAAGFQWGKARRTSPVVFTMLVAVAVALLVTQTDSLAGAFGPGAVVAVFIGYWLGWLPSTLKRTYSRAMEHFLFRICLLVGSQLRGGWRELEPLGRIAVDPAHFGRRHCCLLPH